MKLVVIDFDGTLFKSPENTPRNIRLYEEATGLPWLISKELSVQLTQKHKKLIPIRRGWWGRYETLEPPITPDPVPGDWFIQETVNALKQAKTDPESLPIIMTGRYLALQNQILRILYDGKVIDIEKNMSIYKNIDSVPLLCLGMDGPVKDYTNKPSETFPWKCWIMEQYCLAYQIDSIEIWEDREEHIEKFKLLNLGVPIKVIPIKLD